MASLTNKPNGRKQLQFTCNAKRHTWRMGVVDDDVAKEAKLAIENIINCQESGSAWRPTTKVWVDNLSEKWSKKLSSFGLIESNISQQAPHELGPFFEFVIDEYYHPAEQAGTILNWNQAKDKAIEYFGADKLVSKINSGDIELFELHMRRQSYANSTVGGHLRKLRTLMRRAIKHELISKDKYPFEGIEISGKKDRERKVYVPVDKIRKLFQVCNPRWVAAICLVRFNGFRSPSDVFNLPWDAVDFIERKIIHYRRKTCLLYTSPSPRD